MSTERLDHTATVLADGRVLVAGGRDDANAVIASAEIYDPATGGWTPAPAMPTQRTGAAASLMPDGTVVVTGGLPAFGLGVAPVRDAARFAPAAGAWSALPPMDAARQGHVSVALADGSLVIAGGTGAVRGEGVLALAYWWGVSREAVHRWRRASGVERYNPGSAGPSVTS